MQTDGFAVDKSTQDPVATTNITLTASDRDAGVVNAGTLAVCTACTLLQTCSPKRKGRPAPACMPKTPASSAAHAVSQPSNARHGGWPLGSRPAMRFLVCVRATLTCSAAMQQHMFSDRIIESSCLTTDQTTNRD